MSASVVEKIQHKNIRVNQASKKESKQATKSKETSMMQTVSMSTNSTSASRVASRVNTTPHRAVRVYASKQEPFDGKVCVFMHQMTLIMTI